MSITHSICSPCSQFETDVPKWEQWIPVRMIHLTCYLNYVRVCKINVCVGVHTQYTSKFKQFTRRSVQWAAWCLREQLFNKSNLGWMDIDPKRISQGDGPEQRIPKAWGGYLLSWGKSTREGGWERKIISMRASSILFWLKRAVIRSINWSHKFCGNRSSSVNRAKQLRSSHFQCFHFWGSRGSSFRARVDQAHSGSNIFT